MTLETQFAIFFTFTLAAMSPGPNFVLAITLTLAQGRPVGWAAVVGVVSANIFFSALALFGVTALLAIWPDLTRFVRGFGGMFLLWFAYKLWVNATQKLDWEKTEKTVLSLPAAFLTGLATNLANPKAMTFFFSIFAVLVPTEASPGERLYIITVCGLINITWYVTVVAVFGIAAIRRLMDPIKFWLNRSAAIFLGGLGLWMVATLFISI
jgi:threonine/homoserine/homoserine lactone efflux protein